MQPLPPRDFSKRPREYLLRSYDEVTAIVKAFLFEGRRHRQLDETILGMDPSKSKGYQSMGVLHYLGLKKEFTGIFSDIEPILAIERMKQDPQEFSDIIQRLDEHINSPEFVFDSLLKEAKLLNPDLEGFDEKKLLALDSTDAIGATSLQRREQALLRRLLFQKKEVESCSLCHLELPVSLLVAAHIIPRSKCSPQQRRDKNIVMPTCKIGCDELFETGYLTVKSYGRIHQKSSLIMTDDLKTVLSGYENKQCLSYNDLTKTYFELKLRIINNSTPIS